MLIEFDSLKRDKTLADRGLDFAHAAEVLDGHQFTLEDDRKNYSESRFITVGMLDGHMVMVVWTPRGINRRIISMRKCNEREQALYKNRLD